MTSWRRLPASGWKSAAFGVGMGMTRHPRMGVICPNSSRTESYDTQIA